jgi:hypothetical protein
LHIGKYANPLPHRGVKFLLMLWGGGGIKERRENGEL